MTSLTKNTASGFKSLNQTPKSSTGDWTQIFFQITLSYHKLVETFHVASEFQTAVYFNWWLTAQFSVDQVTVTVYCVSLLYYSQTYQEFTVSNRDRTRPYKTFIITVKLLIFFTITNISVLAFEAKSGWSWFYYKMKKKHLNLFVICRHSLVRRGDHWPRLNLIKFLGTYLGA